MKKQLYIVLFTVLCSFTVSAQTILGVDVSSYEGTINWSQVKAAGYTFAFAKATEGVGLTDSYFVGNQVNGKAAGMVMGAYHFAHPENNTAVAEANYFLGVAGPYIKSCYLPPVLDLEDPPSGPSLSTYFTSAQLTAWVQTWMTTVQNATGIAPIIYIGPSNASYVNSSLNTWGLWIDDYSSSPTAPPPNIGVWTTWDFKQYSWVGTVPGISGTANCDMDVYHGTMNQFNTLIGCNAVLASFTSNVKSVCPGSSVTYTDHSTSTGSITGWHWTFAGGSPGTSSVQNPVVMYNTPGVYSVKEVVTSSVGADSVTYTTYIDVPQTGSLPMTEDFQTSTFPPAGWYLNIPNTGDSTWRLCTTSGYSSSQSMFFPANCGNTSNISGERQQLYTPDYNFSTAVHPAMWFDVAYEPSHVPTYSDTLVIYYSADCGVTWTSLYSKGGMTLCTTGSTTGAGTDTAGSHGHGCFMPPNTAAWRTDSVNIAAVAGKTNVMFSFESRSGWGNIVYLDNINITDHLTTGIQTFDEHALVKVYPNPNKGSFSIDFSDRVNERARLVIYDLLGRPVYDVFITTGITPVTLNAESGVYFYRIMSENGNRFISEGKVMVHE
ncbi:MAG TPA: GH25 family lysozyme [Bacteroidia bacterium]|jgi:GH25 family lysozyme M1 (1,4-beta-N-acetylmuramidase)|nr:GH25 family lysozyme [Bacteroidia bacterium]